MSEPIALDVRFLASCAALLLNAFNACIANNIGSMSLPQVCISSAVTCLAISLDNENSGYSLIKLSIALTLLGFLLADYIKGSAPYWLNVNLAEAFSFKAGINCSNNNKQNSNQLYTQQNFTHREIKAKLPSPRHF